MILPGPFVFGTFLDNRVGEWYIFLIVGTMLRGG